MSTLSRASRNDVPDLARRSADASFQCATEAAHDLERFLTTLGTIATAAPLLGLFGTVIGMIEIFGSQSPSGTNPQQLAQLINKGHQAVKDIDTNIQTIVHIDQGNDNARFRWFYDLMTQNGAQFDIIGASYYPHWLGTDYTVTIADLGLNLKDMVTRYNKPVMVVEVGGDYWQVENSKDLLIATIGAAKDVPQKGGLAPSSWRRW